MFPWSVMPRAGWPSATAAATKSPTRAAPSSMENSVWVCRCVNDRSDTGPPFATSCETYTCVIHPGPSNLPAAPSGRATDAQPRHSEVGAGPPRLACRGQSALAHLLELGPGGHLLGHQRRLNAVEESFEPADELRLCDAQLGIARRFVPEGWRHTLELGHQIGREHLREVTNGLLVDLAQPHPTLLVERCRPHLVEQGLDHGADAQDLGGLVHRFGLALLPLLATGTVEDLVRRDHPRAAIVVRAAL